MLKIRKADRLALFHYPVNTGLYPDYPKVVSKPMDLSTVLDKIATGRYPDYGDAYEDMKLMFENCKRFNGAESELGKYASDLQLRWVTTVSVRNGSPPMN